MFILGEWREFLRHRYTYYTGEKGGGDSTRSEKMALEKDYLV